MLRRTMKQYTVFELSRNIGKALEELPFQITKYGRVIAVVNKYNVTLNTSATKLPETVVTSDEPKIEVEQKVKVEDKQLAEDAGWKEKCVEKCEYPGCKLAQVGEAKYTEQNWELGEMTHTMKLCKAHMILVNDREKEYVHT